MTGRQLLIFILVTGLLINGVCAKKRKGGRRNKGKNAADIEESHTGSSESIKRLALVCFRGMYQLVQCKNVLGM